MPEQDQHSTLVDADASNAHDLMWGIIYVAIAFLAAAFLLFWIDDSFDQSDIQLWVGGVAVPLLTFAGFLAVYLGFQAQKEQNRLLSQQHSVESFEAGFFELMNFYNDAVKQITITGTRGKRGERERYKHTGRFAIRELRPHLANGYRKSNSEDERQKVKDAYHDFDEHLGIDFNHYYAIIEGIIDYVEHRSGSQDASLYINILKSQLSGYEKLFLFYYGLSDVAPEGFKEKIERTGLLEHLPEDYLYDEDYDGTHKDFYEESAFQRTNI
jgi:hypothetical protein